MKPIIPWAGNKSPLYDEITSYFPEDFNNYYEPFAGSLAMGSNIFEKYNFFIPDKKYYFNDINESLYNFYRYFTESGLYDEFITSLKDIQNTWNKYDLVKASKALEEIKAYKQELFYSYRKEFNTHKTLDARKAALFYFLTREGFQSLWRVNSKGEYNVPYRNHEKDQYFVYPELDFLNFKVMFQDPMVSLSNKDFSTFIKDTDPQKSDLVYLDPPYDQTFVDYNKNGFNGEMQRILADLVKELTEKGCYCFVSNNHTEYIEDLYEGFEIIDIHRQNTWKATAKNKSEKVPECLIFKKL